MKFYIPLKRKKREGTSSFTLKLDMSKAYDRTNISYDEVCKDRFLFSEGCSKLLYKAKREGKIEGARVGRGDLSITHIFFVDDSILFREAMMECAMEIKTVVNEYEKIFGQLDNLKEHLGGVLGVQISNNPEYLGKEVHSWS
ncbi:non-ltr retroelement reverse transcriptase [Gossypium australe]|uniref:Non-ltr retroelement reverse transcriptase n=1 Tax=Gossypium australe TaxID=47621 RepID=A0A5B6WSW1_9ROSI|nr:non-ltr retroelement reverse transcriptase [Gossypium australe]